MNIKIVTHYEENDKNFSRDYVDIEVFIDDELAREYGDDYHDKGDVKASAFVDGLTYNLRSSEFLLKELNIADRKI